MIKRSILKRLERLEEIQAKIDKLAEDTSAFAKNNKGNPNHDELGRFATKEGEKLDVGQNPTKSNLPAVVNKPSLPASSKQDIDTFVRQAVEQKMDRRSFLRGLVSAAVNSSRVIHAASKVLDPGPPDIRIQLNSPEYIKYMSEMSGDPYNPIGDYADIYRVKDGGWLFAASDGRLTLTFGGSQGKPFATREEAIKSALDPNSPQEEVGYLEDFAKPHASRKREAEQWEKEKIESEKLDAEFQARWAEIERKRNK